MGRSKYRKGGQYIVTIFWPRGQNIVGVKISSHTGTVVCLFTTGRGIGTETGEMDNDELQFGWDTYDSLCEYIYIYICVYLISDVTRNYVSADGGRRDGLWPTPPGHWLSYTGCWPCDVNYVTSMLNLELAKIFEWLGVNKLSLDTAKIKFVLLRNYQSVLFLKKNVW